jgi:hypothetical protein
VFLQGVVRTKKVNASKTTAGRRVISDARFTKTDGEKVEAKKVYVKFSASGGASAAAAAAAPAEPVLILEFKHKADAKSFAIMADLEGGIDGKKVRISGVDGAGRSIPQKVLEAAGVGMTGSYETWRALQHDARQVLEAKGR